MKEYKRLTERDMFGNADIIGLSTEKLYSELCFSETNLLTKALNRLASLEDKIENGTLIELPCKVGDKVYRICGTPKRRYIKEKICWGICFNNFGIEIHTDGAVDVINKTNRNIFLTRAEAEAKLKELKNE